MITPGGDHSLALPALRALNQVYGRPLRVLPFDGHLDIWHPYIGDDDAQNWVRISADDMNDVGANAVAEQIMKTFGTEVIVHVSLDIDGLDHFPKLR